VNGALAAELAFISIVLKEHGIMSQQEKNVAYHGTVSNGKKPKIWTAI
jgi:hypothetical protein